MPKSYVVPALPDPTPPSLALPHRALPCRTEPDRTPPSPAWPYPTSPSRAAPHHAIPRRALFDPVVLQFLNFKSPICWSPIAQSNQLPGTLIHRLKILRLDHVGQ